MRRTSSARISVALRTRAARGEQTSGGRKKGAATEKVEKNRRRSSKPLYFEGLMANGGKRPGSGRKKGVPNKVTLELKALAQPHGPRVIEELAKIMTKSKNEMARIAAAKELLDRGFGKASQP